MEVNKSQEFTPIEGLSLCLAAIATQLSSEVINQWGLFFYSPSEGVGRTIYVTIRLVSIIFVTGTIWDAMTSPLVGSWSDRTPTRPKWFHGLRPSGRRRPFIFWGSIMMTFTAIAFWYPPVEGTSTVNLVYGTVLLCLHWTMFTIAVVPLISLAPEIARSEAARVSAGTWTAVGMILGLAMAAVLPGILIVQLDPARGDHTVTLTVEGGVKGVDTAALSAALVPEEFRSAGVITQTGEAVTLSFTGDFLEGFDVPSAKAAVEDCLPEALKSGVSLKHIESFSATGYRRLSFVLAFLSLVLFQFPVWLIRERYDSEAAIDAQPPLIAGIGDALRNPLFMAYAAAFFFFTAGFLAVQRVLPYWAELGLGGDEGTVTKLMAPFILTALASYAVIPAVARRLHTKWMLVIALFIIASGLPWMYIIGVIDASVNAKIWMGAALFSYCGVGQGILYVMMTPIMGEIIDYDERRTGSRREALYNGLSSVVWKASMAGSITIASLSMDFWGNSAEAPAGVFLVGPIAGFFGFIGFVAMMFYPVRHTAPAPLREAE